MNFPPPPPPPIRFEKLEIVGIFLTVLFLFVNRCYFCFGPLMISAHGFQYPVMDSSESPQCATPADFLGESMAVETHLIIN